MYIAMENRVTSQHKLSPSYHNLDEVICFGAGLTKGMIFLRKVQGEMNSHPNNGIISSLHIKPMKFGVKIHNFLWISLNCYMALFSINLYISNEMKFCSTHNSQSIWSVIILIQNKIKLKLYG